MINKCTFIGRLGADPEMRHTQTGTPVCNFRIACTDRFKDRNGEWQEKTEWVPIVAWARLAEICGEYLHKGSRVYIEGKFTTRSWDDRDGNTRYQTEVVAREMKILDRKKDNQQHDRHGSTSNRSQSRQDYGEQDIPF